MSDNQQEQTTAEVPQPNQKPPTKRRAPRTGKRGRPQGSANRPFVEVLELPALCPKCGSTNLKPVSGKPLIVREIDGAINGRKFNRVEWKDTQCECGQFVRVRKYLLK